MNGRGNGKATVPCTLAVPAFSTRMKHLPRGNIADSIVLLAHFSYATGRYFEVK